MMGVQGSPARLFYDFDLEVYVAADHLLREIARFAGYWYDAPAAEAILQSPRPPIG